MRRTTHLLLMAVLLLVVIGCRRQTAEERIAELRSRYEASLNSWVIQQPPAPPAADATGGEEEAAAGAPATEPAAGEITVEDLVASPQTRDVLLDIVIHHDAQENLPGITVDISHAGSDEVEKGHFRLWVETEDLARGEHRQINHVLAGLEVTPGDRFAVEIRDPVPAAERGEYREFAAGEPATE